MEAPFSESAGDPGSLVLRLKPELNSDHQSNQMLNFVQTSGLMWSFGF